MAPAATLRDRVDEAFRTLPERYLGAAEGFDATYHLRLGDLGRTFEVRCRPATVHVRRYGTSRRPDVVLGTDARTWLELRDGTINGIEAFSQRRLYVRGALDAALAFEGLFRLPDDRPPHLRLHDVPTRAGAISTVTVGPEGGGDVLLVHGLGAAKSSFLEIAAALARQGRRVHAIDLPGFGASAKPALAPYDAPWFAGVVLDWLDRMDLDRVHLVGNSMGGRVVLEVALRAPERVGGLAALCPAVAFVKRGWHPLVRLLRPEVGALPHGFRRSMVAGQLHAMFCDPGALDPAVADVVVDEFQRTYGSMGARLGFLKAARQIYLDRPFGRDGFYPRLAGLEAPSLFVWGTHDPLIPAAFGRHVRDWLPGAEQLVLERCGHVPQVERADEVAGVLRRFLGRCDARAAGPAALRGAA
jgi:pimeloyl-ACP methyl ester carboxylesterase